MTILVAYASKYGATAEIAERVAEKLGEAGREARALPVTDVENPADYEAFVVGSAVYFGKWLKRATAFVRRNRDLLADRPVWLFSSGPLRTRTGEEGQGEEEGRDERAEAEPREIAEFREAVHPRDHRIFYGALRPERMGVRDRMIKALPAGRALFPEGDFREWDEIETWAAEIGRDLSVTG